MRSLAFDLGGRMYVGYRPGPKTTLEASMIAEMKSRSPKDSPAV
jgi:hypothetical protein